MARRKLIAGNWKMNGTLGALRELDGIAAAARGARAVDVAVAVPATLIATAAARVPDLDIGAQDIDPRECGAFTGQISAEMVEDAGARFAIVGHSERRAGDAETDAQVKAKAEAANRAGLRAILCVGETADERDAGRAHAVVTGQLEQSFPQGGASGWLSVAYEPAWAIGTGRTPTVAEIATMHGAVRKALRARIGDDADAVRILYGGSVTATNAAELLSAGDVDGALVGGASLTAAKFVPIIVAAQQLTATTGDDI